MLAVDVGIELYLTKFCFGGIFWGGSTAAGIYGLRLLRPLLRGARPKGSPRSGRCLGAFIRGEISDRLRCPEDTVADTLPQETSVAAVGGRLAGVVVRDHRERKGPATSVVGRMESSSPQGLSSQWPLLRGFHPGRDI